MVERLVDQSQDLPYRPAAVVPVALAYALCFEHNHTLGPKQWGTFRRSAKSGGPAIHPGCRPSFLSGHILGQNGDGEVSNSALADALGCDCVAYANRLLIHKTAI